MTVATVEKLQLSQDTIEVNLTHKYYSVYFSFCQTKFDRSFYFMTPEQAKEYISKVSYVEKLYLLELLRRIEKDRNTSNKEVSA